MTSVPEWFTDWLDTITVLDFILWLVGVGAIFLFIAKGWPFLRRFVSMVDALSQLPEFIKTTTTTLSTQNATLAQIKHEVLPNSGGSLRDEVDRQGVRQQEHGDTLADMKKKLDVDNDRINDLEHSIPRLPKHLE